MKQLFSITLLVATICLFQSCKKINGEGPVITQMRSHINFTGVAFNIHAELNYTQDSVYKVEIKAQQNILNEIETFISNGTLKIRTRNNVNLHSYDRITINISAPQVNDLGMGGSGTMRILPGYKPAYCRIKLSGSGNINITDLSTANVEANVSGSGEIRVNSGTVATADFRVSGSGLVDFLSVNATAAVISISGSGVIRTKVNQSLDATITGSGNVYYMGNVVPTTHLTGSGRVIRL